MQQSQQEQQQSQGWKALARARLASKPSGRTNRHATPQLRKGADANSNGVRNAIRSEVSPIKAAGRGTSRWAREWKTHSG